MMVSACWIVKDEAENIAASILSAANCARELIVVDTGSSDATVRVAMECGARVERFAWCDDFSAAKNYALSLARGDYVIFIDGDEYFSPPLQKHDRAAIARAFEETGADCVQILRTEIEAATGEATGSAPYIRILKREAVHYEGRIHEIPRTQSGAPLVFYLEGYRLMHTGYSAGRGEQKLRRNVRLLELEQPELCGFRLFHNKAYLLREYMALGDYDNAYANCRYLLDHGEHWPEACKVYAGYLERIYSIIQLASERREWFGCEEIREAFELIERHFPNTRDAALAELGYQMIFAYDEERFLRSLEQAEKSLAAIPAARPRRMEAALFAKGAMAAYRRGDFMSARRWANVALECDTLESHYIL